MKKKPAKSDKKSNANKPIKTGNMHGGFFGHMYRRYKGDMKKAHSAYTAVANNVRQWTKTKDKDYMVRDYLDSQYGRKLGKFHKNQGHVALDFKRFAQKYNPQTFKQVQEETEMVKKEVNEGKRLKRLGKAIGHELGLTKPGPLGVSRLRRATSTAIHLAAQGGPMAALAAATKSPQAGAAAAAMAAAGFGLQVRHRYKHLKSIGEDTEALIQDLIDAGATEADIAFITEEEDMSSHFDLIEAIVSDKPLDAKELFASILHDKLVETVELYKMALTESTFNPSDEDDEFDEDEDELTEEEIEDLENLDLEELTDEELEELAELFDDEEVVEEDESPLEINEISRRLVTNYAIKAHKDANRASDEYDEANFNADDAWNDGDHEEEKLEKARARAADNRLGRRLKGLRMASRRGVKIR